MGAAVWDEQAERAAQLRARRSPLVWLLFVLLAGLLTPLAAHRLPGMSPPRWSVWGPSAIDPGQVTARALDGKLLLSFSGGPTVDTDLWWCAIDYRARADESPDRVIIRLEQREMRTPSSGDAPNACPQATGGPARHGAQVPPASGEARMLTLFLRRPVADRWVEIRSGDRSTVVRPS